MSFRDWSVCVGGSGEDAVEVDFDQLVDGVCLSFGVRRAAEQHLVHVEGVEEPEEGAQQAVI